MCRMVYESLSTNRSHLEFNGEESSLRFLYTSKLGKKLSSVCIWGVSLIKRDVPARMPWTEISPSPLFWVRTSGDALAMRDVQ